MQKIQQLGSYGAWKTSVWKKADKNYENVKQKIAESVDLNRASLSDKVMRRKNRFLGIEGGVFFRDRQREKTKKKVPNLSLARVTFFCMHPASFQSEIQRFTITFIVWYIISQETHTYIEKKTIYKSIHTVLFFKFLP